MPHTRNETLSSSDEKLLIGASQFTRSPSDVSFPHGPLKSPSRESADSSDSQYTEPTIPPNHRHRTLVLCFDGTGNGSCSFESSHTFLTISPCPGDQFDDDVGHFFYRNPQYEIDSISLLELEHCQLFLDVEEGRPETAACLLSGMQHNLVTYPNSHIHLGRYWDVHHPTNCETYDGKISQGARYHGGSPFKRARNGCVLFPWLLYSSCKPSHFQQEVMNFSCRIVCSLVYDQCSWLMILQTKSETKSSFLVSFDVLN
jgi:hypothetical protein